MNENILSILELNFERKKQFIPERLRPFYQNLPGINDLKGVLIYGLRGVGKTTFLISQVAKSNANILYFSADNPLITSIPLYELVSEIFRKGYDGIIIDEIHYANNWSVHIKALYDDYPDKIIWISDSSNLILQKAVSDLSRRFVQYKIPLMSFREYLFLEHDLHLNTINPFIEKDRAELIKKISNFNIMKFFLDYLNEGIRPIYKEGEYCLRLKALLDKTIYSDIPFYVKSIQDNHLRLMNAIIGFLLNSPIPTLNISGMCRDWKVGKEKLYNLLEVMEKSELLNIVKKQGKSFFTKGAKIFFSDPSYYYCFNGNVGNSKEAFFVMNIMEKQEVFTSKNEKEYDFLLNNGIKIEIGGKSKKIKNADFVICDDIDIPFKNRLPLWLMGFLW